MHSFASAAKLASTVWFFFQGWCSGRVETQKCRLRITDMLACFDFGGAAALKCAAVMNSKVHQGNLKSISMMATLFTPPRRKTIYEQDSFLSWVNITNSEGAGILVSAMVLDLTLPFLSLACVNEAAVCLFRQYLKVLLDCGTKEAEKMTPLLCGWDKVLWFKQAMVPCYILPGCGKMSWECFIWQ